MHFWHHFLFSPRFPFFLFPTFTESYQIWVSPDPWDLLSYFYPFGRFRTLL